MKVKANQNTLEKLLYTLDKNYNEGNLIFHEDGLVIAEPDPAKVLLTKIVLDEEFFETYEPEIEEKKKQFGSRYVDGDGYAVGVNFEDLYRVVEAVRSDELELEVREDEIAVSYGDNEMTIPILNLEVEELEVDEINFEQQFEVNTEDFMNTVEDLEMVGDAIEMITSDSGLVMKAESNRTSGEFLVDYSEGNPDSGTRSMYPEDYLKNMRQSLKKIVPKDSDLEIRFGEDKPLLVKPDAKSNEFKWVLAPRIEEK